MEEWVFVEVKTRSSTLYGMPKDAIDKTKKKHIYKSIEYYVHINHLENRPIRIDVIGIYKKQEKFELEHIKNAIIELP